MRSTLRSFAFLDVISLVFMSMQLWVIASHYQELSEQFSEKVRAILMFPMFAVVLIGAIGLFRLKRFGLFLYYIQFPFRLYLWIFSVGFITLLPELFTYYDDKLSDVLFKACFVAEFIRLYLTIKIHLNNNR